MIQRGEVIAHSPLADLERRRRGFIALAIALIVMAGFSPLLSHHLLPVSEGGIERGHFIALCLVVLQALMAPLHELFHALLWTGLLYAVWDRGRAWRLGQRELSLLDVREVGAHEAVLRAARVAGLDSARVRVVCGLPGAALTVGWWMPLVYIAQETVEQLDHPQLVAVLAHEGAHVRRRDPLRLSILRFLSCLFFWIPALRQLADDFADEIEILADDAAAAGQPLVLASALVEVAKFGQPLLPRTAVGFHHRPLFDRRVRRLVGEAPVPRSHLTRRSILGGALVLVLGLTSGFVVARVSPTGLAAHYTEHCEDHDLPLIGHLLCLLDRPERPTGEHRHQAHSSAI